MDQQALALDSDPERTTTKPKLSRADPHSAADEELYLRYTVAIRELVEEAVALRKPRLIVEAIAWELSRLIDGYGPLAAGDFLRIFGNMLYSRADVRRAQVEAEEAKQQGRRPS